MFFFSYVQVKAGFYYSEKLSYLHVIFEQENQNFAAVLPCLKIISEKTEERRFGVILAPFSS